MKKLSVLFIMVCAFASVNAQTFTQHLQQKAAGSSLGTVKVTQDKDIDALVNNQQQAQKQATPAQKPAEKKEQQKPAEKKQEPAQKPADKKEQQKPAEKKQEHSQKPAEKKQEQVQKPVEKKKIQPEEQEDNYEDAEAPAPVVPDMSKKVLKNAIKIDGWRVQVYSGGNSRSDKAKATQIGHQIKYAFPDQPVYVHFKSPHWICRMGNYRTQYEAQAFLDQVKSLGYKQAILVKGKITVSR